MGGVWYIVAEDVDLNEPVGGVWDIVAEDIELKEPVGRASDLVAEEDLEEPVGGVGDIVAEVADLEEQVGGVGDIVAMFTLAESSLTAKSMLSIFPSTFGNCCLTYSELKGIMPAIQNPAQMVSGVQVFIHALLKRMEKLYFVISYPDVFTLPETPIFNDIRKSVLSESFLLN